MKRQFEKIELFAFWLRCRRERLCLWCAHRVPHWLRYWVCVDAIARCKSR